MTTPDSNNEQQTPPAAAQVTIVTDAPADNPQSAEVTALNVQQTPENVEQIVEQKIDEVLPVVAEVVEEIVAPVVEQVSQNTAEIEEQKSWQEMQQAQIAALSEGLASLTELTTQILSTLQTVPELEPQTPAVSTSEGGGDQNSPTSNVQNAPPENVTEQTAARKGEKKAAREGKHWI